MDKKMSREQAEKLADELLAQQPRHVPSAMVKALSLLGKVFEDRHGGHEFNQNPFISPAHPAYSVMHRDTDTSK